MAFPSASPAAVSGNIGEFLCNKGMAYFDNNQLPEALVEFKKALLANPESELARAYIELIEEWMVEKASVSGEDADKEKAVALSLKEIESRYRPKPEPVEGRQMIRHEAFVPQTQAPDFPRDERQVSAQVPVENTAVIVPVAAVPVSFSSVQETAEIDVNTIENDEIQMSVGQRLLLKGFPAKRQLVTHPAILKSDASGQDFIIEGLDMGNSYLHLWDGDGRRKSYRILIGPRRFDENASVPGGQKIYDEGLPEPFKFGYSISGNTYMSGRGIGDIQRLSNTMAYSASITGGTPYGRFDTSVQANRTNQGNYRVSNLRLALLDAHYDQFKDIDIRGFDYSPSFSSFGFPAVDLRGVKVDAPMFNKKLDYSAFWGAIPLGDFTFLSPDAGLSKTKKAWIEGLGVDYRPVDSLYLRSFYAHSYGPELVDPVVTNEVFGAEMSYDLGAWNFMSGMASDTTHISYTAGTTMTLEKLRVNLNMIENSKNFASLLGGVPTTGSTAGSLSFNYRPYDNLTLFNSFSVDRDKVFFNPADPSRVNYNSTTRVSWALDKHTELEGGYIMDDRQGSNTPVITETKEISLRKKFYFLRQLNTYLMFQNRRAKNYLSAAQDYDNNRLLLGVNFKVLADLYFYYNQEWDFLYNTYTKESAIPRAQEFGLNYSRQILQTPFYTNLRLYYRDEQNTESILSFLSGEDRLEGEAELAYRPSAGNEAFFKMRVDDVWAEREGVAKHFDVNLNWGVRFLWDSGLRWPSDGTFYGYVFYDLNADGIRQPEEDGISGVRVVVNGKKDAFTNRDGYYQIQHIPGKKAILSIDISSVPKGYNPTVSSEKQVDVVHARRKRHDFGLSTRNEISGLVFVDRDRSGSYEAGEEVIKNIVLVLDERTRTATNTQGTYMFRKFSPGKHTITLDLRSVPVQYIPKVQVSKTIQVEEGTTFIYNIPLELQEAPGLSKTR